MNLRLRRGENLSLVVNDGNQETYDASRDGRGEGNRVEQIRVDRIETSRFQVRRVFEDREVESLADSIRSAGLIHFPKGRPHPEKPGWIELMPGEMRCRAMARLIERGEADGILERDHEENWLIPVLIEDASDERADEIVMRENLDRTDLSPWEWALAFQGRRDRRRKQDLPARVEDLATEWQRGKSQMGDFLLAADLITFEVLEGAGVVAADQPDHRRLARLTLAALKRVANTNAREGVAVASAVLLKELDSAGDAAAAARLKNDKTGRQRAASVPTGFQLNIRQPLDRLGQGQALHFLGKMVPAVSLLAGRVEGMEPERRAELADRLAEAADRLRAGLTSEDGAR